MNAPAPQTLRDSSLEDISIALATSFERMGKAANNVFELLQLAGVTFTKGDTGDDLINAMAIHGHLLQQFDVKIRTHRSTDVCTVTAFTQQGAYAAAAERQGDEPFGISVLPAAHGDLALAHRALRITGSLKEALKNPALNIAIHSYARSKRRSLPNTDFKRNAANDRD